MTHQHLGNYNQRAWVPKELCTAYLAKHLKAAFVFQNGASGRNC